MDQIAEQAEVSKPVLYQHFSGKRELFLDLVDDQFKILNQSLADAMNTQDNNKDRVRATVLAYYRYMDRKDGAYRILFASGLDHDPEIAQRLQSFNESFIDQISAHVLESTDLDEQRARIIGHGTAGTVTNAAEHWAKTKNHLTQDYLAESDHTETDQPNRQFPTLEEAAEITFTLIWRGILPF